MRCVQYLAGSGKDSDSAKDSKQLEADLLKSDLWTTVFRGGYVVKQLERSFSGRHVCCLTALHQHHLYVFLLLTYILYMWYWNRLRNLKMIR